MQLRSDVVNGLTLQETKNCVVKFRVWHLFIVIYLET